MLNERRRYSTGHYSLSFSPIIALLGLLIFLGGPITLSAQNSSLPSPAPNQTSTPASTSSERLLPPLITSSDPARQLEPSERQQQQAYFTYEDPQDRFSIDYPIEWRVGEGNSGVVTVSSRFEGSFDPFAANFAIGVENLTAGESLDNYTRSVVSLLQSEPPGPNFTLRDGPISTTFGGFPAQSVVFTVTSPNERGLGLKPILEGVQIWTVHNNFAYILSFAAEQDKFSRYAPIMEHIIESFRLTRTAG